MKKFIVGITGASGSVYAQKLLTELAKGHHTIYLTITPPGLRVLAEEIGWHLSSDVQIAEKEIRRYIGLAPDDISLRYFDITDVGALIASGSVPTDGMIVVPCTMATVSAIAHGTASDLLQRAADVIIKERRKLLIVPRETPLSAIHLENMLRLAQLGVYILPAMPAFYNKPKTLEDITAFMVGRILDYFEVSHELYQRWEG